MTKTGRTICISVLHSKFWGLVPLSPVIYADADNCGNVEHVIIVTRIVGTIMSASLLR